MKGDDCITQKNKDIPYLLILTHGKWGVELVEGAEMICGNLKNIFAFPLMPDQSLIEYVEPIEEILRNAPEGSIILVDLFGGTTSNIAALLSSKYNILAVTGLNIAMLITASEVRGKYGREEIWEKLLNSSINNYKNLTELLRNNLT
ncbi:MULTISPECIES: hypothetical protein [Tepidanaerobacter]|uniref:PTS sugar transporter subunit IIA n=1 Tax=Tepidanaerobacter TaxID=499228 RepID=UPI000A6B274A|nr:MULTISPECIES: hypothetical protein [Tepidanaerobacter]